ncbi:hypothetical protein IOD13_13160 [Brevibacterium casei]|nr:hypothetical protein [Brevibacterium casei]
MREVACGTVSARSAATAFAEVSAEVADSTSASVVAGDVDFVASDVAVCAVD